MYYLLCSYSLWMLQLQLTQRSLDYSSIKAPFDFLEPQEPHQTCSGKPLPFTCGIELYVIQKNIYLSSLLWPLHNLRFHLLISWSRVLPQNLTGPQLVIKYPAFYGTRRFITAFWRARHLSLSWARSIQSMPASADVIHDSTVTMLATCWWLTAQVILSLHSQRRICSPSHTCLYIIFDFPHFFFLLKDIQNTGNRSCFGRPSAQSRWVGTNLC
jgi:hypothetical protein